MDWSASKPPTARDIAAYYRKEIADGRMGPLSQLPPYRALAKQLHVAAMTVQSAYRQLREEGLVDSRHGSGTFVRDAVAGEPGAQETALGFRELEARLREVTDRLDELSERVTSLEADSTAPR